MSSREETYCVKERKYTKNINPTIKTSKNGNKYIQSTCLICGNKKNSFIKSLQKDKTKLEQPKNGKSKLSEGVAKSKDNVVNIKDFFYKKNKK